MVTKKFIEEMKIELDAERTRKEMEENLPVLYVVTWTTTHKKKSGNYKRFETRTLSFVFDHFSKVINIFEEYRQSIINGKLQVVEENFNGNDELYVYFAAEDNIERHTLQIETTKMNKTLNGFC